ncbi:putative ankyrin repeat protein RF_0381 [Cloeon dipterum]|uniref:putative ankyrin repeat protein RF_0381 n=1 Tax=Cloeon dipterum TaxID=197152 RepID=UPI00322073E1
MQMRLEDKLAFIQAHKGLLPALHFAVMVGCWKVFQLLLKGEVDIRAKCGLLGATALHYAATNVERGGKIVRSLLLHGLKANEPDAQGRFPLEYALEARNFPVARILVEQCNPFPTLLDLFISSNHLRFAKMVVAEEAPTAASVQLAARFADLQLCQWLVEEIKPLDDSWRGTILHSAVRNMKHAKDLIPFFARHQPNVDQTDSDLTPLRIALAIQNIGALEVLVRLGANFKAKVEMEDISFNLLQLCAVNNLLESLKFVFRTDSEQVEEAEIHQENILSLAVIYSDVKLCEWLVEQGIDFKVKSKKGSLLHYAALNHRFGEEVTRFLASRMSLEVNFTNYDGETALHVAIENGNVSVVKVLIENGADLTVKLEGNNYLHCCVIHDTIDCAKLLHERNFDLITEKQVEEKRPLETPSGPENQKIPLLEFPAMASLEEKEEFVLNNRAETPMLLFASKVGDLEICRYFVEERAHDVGTVDEKGSNVFHYAARNAAHGLALLEYFASLGADVKRKNAAKEGAEIIAVKEGNFDFAIALFNKRAEDTSFLEYCIGNNAIGLDILKCLYEKKASEVYLNEKFDSIYLMARAAAFRDLDTMKWVIQICDVRKEMLGEALAGYKDVKVESISRFLELVGKKMDKILIYPLHFASEHSRPDVCEWMVRHQGFRVSAVDKDSLCTVLHYSVLNKSHALANIKFFAPKMSAIDVNRKDTLGKTALHFALRNARLDVAEELIKYGADLDVDFKGCNLLLYCVGTNELSSAKFVYEKKKSLVNGPGPDGKTALRIATKFENKPMIQWLREITTSPLNPT